MPILSTLTLMTLVGAIVCGGAIVSARAEDNAGSRDLKTRWDTGGEEPRDLKPVPHKPAAKVKRPAVSLRPSAAVVAVGSPISFEVGSSVHGFGHIYVLSASGRVQVWMENVPIPAGQRLQFPTGSMGILAAAPAGREDLMLIVTKERIDGFLGYETTRSPRLLDYGHQAFKQAVAAKFVDRPQREWGYARATVQVVERLPTHPTWGWGPAAAGPADLWAGQWEDDD
jgi:hypothetical protein